MKNDLKVEMAPVGRPDERLDRTISYVNGSLSNAEFVTLAQQLVGLTTNTYLGGEKIQRSDISEPGGGSSKTEGVITFDTSSHVVTYNGDAPYVTYMYTSDSDFYYLATVASGAVVSPYSNKETQIFFATATDNYTAAVLVNSD